MIRVCCIFLLLLCGSKNCFGEIPYTAQRHRNVLIRVAHEVWGIDAPIALFAAQIHTESLWHETAVSPVGAQGIAQFMPETAAWLPTIAPETGEPLPFNPAWSLRALVTYDLWLWNRVDALYECDQVAFMLSAYNGGLGWVQRDKRMAKDKGLNPNIYWDCVENVNAGRRKSAFQENRKYPKVILHTFQKEYEKAGWGRGVECDWR